MDLNELKKAYEGRRQVFERLAQSARYHLQLNLEQKKIKVHTLLHRIKELDSLWEKAERQGAKDPLHDIHDLVGLRVVCLFRSDIPRVLGIIRESFEVVEEENKEDRSEKRTFEYMAVHIIARMRPKNAGFEGAVSQQIPVEIQQIAFEIQVRTIGQDAWACISHHLAYKQEASFPPDHVRDLSALSALFYLADIHFELLRTACAQSLTGKSTDVL